MKTQTAESVITDKKKRITNCANMWLSQKKGNIWAIKNVRTRIYGPTGLSAIQSYRRNKTRGGLIKCYIIGNRDKKPQKTALP